MLTHWHTGQQSTGDVNTLSQIPTEKANTFSHVQLSKGLKQTLSKKSTVNRKGQHFFAKLNIQQLS